MIWVLYLHGLVPGGLLDHVLCIAYPHFFGRVRDGHAISFVELGGYLGHRGEHFTPEHLEEPGFPQACRYK
jgi:hypothetical protein